MFLKLLIDFPRFLECFAQSLLDLLLMRGGAQVGGRSGRRVTLNTGRLEAGGGVLVGQRHQRIHVVDGEKAGVSVQHPLEPVVIDLVGQGDDVALLEA